MLWIDSEFDTIKTIANTASKSTLFHYVASNTEANVWTTNNSIVLHLLIKQNRFKIVSNNFRKADGGEEAPYALLKLIQKKQLLRNTSIMPLLIYCGTFSTIIIH